jgi:phosphoribosylglycinamide formyltransferase-1
VHLVTAELDEGPVLAQTEVAVMANDSVDSLAARVLIAEHQTYSRALAAYVTRECDPAWLLDQVRQRAMALPGVEERTSHGSPGFSIVGSKFFALFSQYHHGDERVALLVKTSGSEEQSMLLEQDDDLYYLPPYYGPSGWIGIRLDLGQTDWDHIASWLQKSWLICAPAKLRKSFDIAADF